MHVGSVGRAVAAVLVVVGSAQASGARDDCVGGDADACAVAAEEAEAAGLPALAATLREQEATLRAPRPERLTGSLAPDAGVVTRQPNPEVTDGSGIAEGTTELSASGLVFLVMGQEANTSLVNGRGAGGQLAVRFHALRHVAFGAEAAIAATDLNFMDGTSYFAHVTVTTSWRLVSGLYFSGTAGLGVWVASGTYYFDAPGGARPGSTTVPVASLEPGLAFYWRHLVVRAAPTVVVTVPATVLLGVTLGLGWAF